MSSALTAEQLAGIRERLAKPFPSREIKWKPQQVKSNRALAMAYIDARIVMERLDDVFGVAGWTDRYTVIADGSVECRLSIRFGDRWVSRADVGSQSEQPDHGDRMKAAYSDALKRAAVKFGIGRYLYRLPSHWVDYDPVSRKIVKPPVLPDFAVPPEEKSKGKAPVPAQSPVQSPAQSPPPAADGTGVPQSGAELHRRLNEYDQKLSAQKVCQRGALLAHVVAEGVKAGFTANMLEWSGPAIPFAVEAVKRFERSAAA